MKLVLCIVTDKDANNLVDKLVEEGYRATKLASTGGFLKKGNTTVFIGVDEERVDSVLEIISTNCEVRKKLLTPISPMPGPAESYIPYSVEVSVGGATVFVLDVEKFLKV